MRRRLPRVFVFGLLAALLLSAGVWLSDWFLLAAGVCAAAAAAWYATEPR